MPYLYKPKLQYCVHKKPNIQENSWEHNINWKHFNQRYADFFEDCYICNKNTPCRPQCDCTVHKYSDAYSSYWFNKSEEWSETDSVTNCLEILTLVLIHFFQQDNESENNTLQNDEDSEVDLDEEE